MESKTEVNTYRQLLSRRSTYVENILTHQLVAAIASRLWYRNPSVQLNIFNSEVDDSGFDLVLGWKGQVRYIQIKQVHSKGRASKFSVSLEFSRLIGSCVVVIIHSETDLTMESVLFFGNTINEAMPNLENERMSRSSIKKDKNNEKKIRTHYRDVPKKKFYGPLSIDELLDKLFSS